LPYLALPSLLGTKASTPDLGRKAPT
jgi:hypothetical protein